MGRYVDRIGTMWSDLAGRISGVWGGLNRQNRTLALTGAVVIVALIASMALLYARGPSYSTLFSNLSAEDAASVTQRLKDDKVSYRLSTDGKTVYVPDSSLSDERVAIAGSGVLKGGSSGYELFDRTNFGMTEFQEKLDKTRAIEGELQRTLADLAPVESARVHIAAPDDALYSSSQAPTTASVAITEKAGQSLSPDQVKGITALVAGAVENLKPENVTIINQDGSVLLPSVGSGSTAEADGGADALKMTQEQLLAKQRYETNLQENIQSMLDSSLGKKRAIARVSTKMNFDANATDSKTYAPAGTVLSSQSKRESYTGTQPARTVAAGVPGTTTNIGTYQGLLNNQTNGKYNKTENTTNYNISVSNTKHVDAPGKVTQTSVAVLVNSAPDVDPNAPAAIASAAYTLTPAMVLQIRNTVVAAAGLDLAQGDQVSVEAVPFNPSVAAPEAGAGNAGTTMVLGIPLWVLLALGGVGILALLGMLAARTRRTAWSPDVSLPSFDSSLAEELPPFEEHPMLDGTPGLASPIRSAADLTREQMIEYVTTVAQENPDSIAKLVKLWLAE